MPPEMRNLALRMGLRLERLPRPGQPLLIPVRRELQRTSQGLAVRQQLFPSPTERLPLRTVRRPAQRREATVPKPAKPRLPVQHVLLGQLRNR